jgi:putative YphP/YqiW family bacilliredoxin
MPYDEQMVAPMRAELTRLGVKELKSVADVDAVLGDPEGTQLVFVNSVCGCAAGTARPGLALALKHQVLPTGIYTVFAGQDVEAVARARSYFADYQPSSPAIALLREGEVVWFMHRHQIEGRSAEAIASDLRSAFDQHVAQKTA